MPNQRTLKCIFTAIFSILLLSCTGIVTAQTDSVAAADTMGAKTTKKKDTTGHQLCVGLDIFHPVMNLFQIDRTAWEFQVDYYLRNEFYATMEAGWGSSKADFTDLKYTTTNNFVRIGFNKSVLGRDRPTDWDMMLFGLKLGIANVHRSSATYMIADSVWGNTGYMTASPKPDFIAVWVELAAGMRVELLHGFFAGWNVRGKFMMNAKSFNDLAPLYIAGYGRGDKNSAFDLNVYLSYAIRWAR